LIIIIIEVEEGLMKLTPQVNLLFFDFALDSQILKTIEQLLTSPPPPPRDNCFYEEWLELQIIKPWS